MAKVLATRTRVRDEDGSVIVYNAGDKPSAAHAKLITNPDAWTEDSRDEEAAGPGGFFDDVTRQQMLKAAEDIGADVAKSAGKEAIAAAIKRKLFEDANPHAKLADPTSDKGVKDGGGADGGSTA